MLQYFKSVRSSLFFLIVFILFHYLSKSDSVLSIEEIALLVKEFFERYGLIAVGTLSFIENIVGVNAFFPGSIVILTAMAMTAGDPLLGLFTYFTIFSFAIISYHLNFFLGKYLSYKNPSTEKDLSKKTQIELWLWYLSTFWHPHFTAITCVITGSEGFSYKWFFSRMIIAGFLWNSFWGITMYNFGSIAKENYDLTIIMYIYFIGWLAVDSYKYFRTSSDR